MRKNLPPSMPTPRSFLPVKRTTSMTPAPHAQFQSTPRFGSSSVPRPTQTRGSLVEDVEDVEEEQEQEDDDGGPDTDSSAAAPGKRRQLPRTQDSIEVESEGPSTSPDEQGSFSDRASDCDETREETRIEARGGKGALHVHSSPEQSQAKRRRISISSAVQSSPLSDHYPDTQPASDEDESSRGAGERHSTPALPSPATAAAPTTRPAPQPVFWPAPRFKTADDPDAAPGMLPLAFSPQRRGERYLTGGLAAELQGWLSEAKGWDGVDRTPARDGAATANAAALRISVDEVRPGRHMHLVRGRAGADAVARAFVLAGQGRLTGLGAREGNAAMEAGSVVTVGPPVWDVEIEGCVWTVACDWSVA